MAHLSPSEQSGQPIEQPSLALVEDDIGALAPRRSPAEAQRLAQQHSYLVRRTVDRLAVSLPAQVDEGELLARGFDALTDVAAVAESTEEFPRQAIGHVMEAVRGWLSASEWYREGVVGRAEPLLRAWRALDLAGRERTDEALCRKLAMPQEQLPGLFVEFATMFALEPTVFLPTGTDIKYSMADIIASLETEQQLVMALYSHQELTLPEIANVMGQEPERVQELFGRAAAHVCAEASLASWPGHNLVA